MGRHSKPWLAAVCGGMVSVLPQMATAQAPLTVDRATIAGGGGASTGGTLSLVGTIGQPVATSASTAGTLGAAAGFLVPVLAGTPPTITAIAPVVTTPETPRTITFGLADTESPAAALAVTATSTTSVVAPEGLALAGVGAARALTITPAPAQLGSTIITVRVVDPDGQIAERSFAFTVTAQTAADTFRYYLAEGATSSFFDTQLALLNPGDVATTATLTFVQATQAPVSLQVPLPARTRRTVWPKDVAGLGAAEFSTSISTSQPVVVDRTMTWNADGYGAHAETAATSPSPVWYLAEGATHSGFQLFYLLQNPGDVATTARVRYLRASGGPLEKTYLLPPRSRTNVWVNVEEFDGVGRALAAAEISAIVETVDLAPVIVERAMYRSTNGRVFDAGHESMGVTTPATRWFLAEGRTGPFFDQFVLIANPDSRDALVRLTYLLDSGQTYVHDIVAPADARTSVWVDRETIPGVAGQPLADVALSTAVESTNGVPLIVERAMWWPGSGDTWHEAHNSAGAIASGTRWALAEGEVGGPRGLQTYVLIANTSAYGGRARVTLVFEDGTTTFRDYPLLAQSRTNAAIGPDFGEAVEGRRFGVVVDALGLTDEAPAPQIVVERAMYSNAGGVPLAAGTNAVATRLR